MSRRKIWLGVLVLAAVGIAFYILNVLTPLYADDYSYLYTFIFTDDKFRITNLSELFYSQLNHYMVTNGRTVAHTLAQLFLMWGKPLYNVLNTAVFLLLGWAVQSLITGRKEFRLSFYLFGIAMLWFFTPAFGQDFLWLTASCTYLYCMLLILLYLIPFRRAYAGGSRGGAVRAALFFPFGLLAGWSAENAAVGMLVIEVCFLVFLRLERKPLRAWMLTGLAGNLAGFALMILAPSQSVRMANSGGTGSLAVWLKRGLIISAQAVRYFWIPALLFAALFIWRLWKDGKGSFRANWRQWRPTGAFLLGSLASAYCMIVTPEFPGRAWGCITIFVILTVGSAAALCPDLKLPRPAEAGACCLVLAAAAATYGLAFRSIYRTHAQAAERTACIEEVLAQGGTETVAEPIRAFSKYNCYSEYGDLVTDSSVWPNTAIARYYGLEVLHSTEESQGDAGE